MECIGIHFATINAVHEPITFRKTGADEVPKLIVILKRNFFIYRDNALTPTKVVGKWILFFKTSTQIDQTVFRDRF